jgi:hypothetical protein
MVSFENFVKSLPPSLSELKVKPIFCFPIKIRDDPTASSKYTLSVAIFWGSECHQDSMIFTTNKLEPQKICQKSCYLDVKETTGNA